MLKIIKNRSALALIFMLLVFSAVFAFDDSCSTSLYSVDASGAQIRKAGSDVIDVYLVEPYAGIIIKNRTGNTLGLKLKITNISPEKYSLIVDSAKVTDSGIKSVTAGFELKAGQEKKFIIKPRLKSEDKFTFAVLGDPKTNRRMHQRILSQIAKTDSIFAMSTGDLMQWGYEKEYRDYIKEISGFPLPYFVAAGNHEVAVKGGRERFCRYINPFYYSFTLGKFNFIILDNSDGGISPEQFRWLESELKSHKNNLVFMHKPPYSPKRRYADHVMDSKAESAKFMKLMEKYRVKAVFAGHIHGFVHDVRNGIDYYITAGAGATLYLLPFEGGYHHYLIVNADGDNIKVNVVKVKR